MRRALPIAGPSVLPPTAANLSSLQILEVEVHAELADDVVVAVSDAPVVFGRGLDAHVVGDAKLGTDTKRDVGAVVVVVAETGEHIHGSVVTSHEAELAMHLQVIAMRTPVGITFDTEQESVGREVHTEVHTDTNRTR